jgi:hypothetical protein
LIETPQEVPEDGARPAHTSKMSRVVARAKTALTQQYSVLVYLIIGFIIAQSIVVFLHYRSAQLNHQVQEVQLARDLYKEFYTKENGYLRVANAIERCEKLSKGDGGKFSHLEINQYLGFFEDLGAVHAEWRVGRADNRPFFGAFIVEAYEYPEIQSYIARIRKNFEQPEAFEDFEKVAKAVEQDPRFVRLAAFAKTMCSEKPEGD